MFKFLYKSFLYLLAALICGSVSIYALIAYNPGYFLGDLNTYIIWNIQMGKIKSKIEYKNIIIGDSRGNASLNPLLLGNNWSNLSLPGTDFFEGFLSVKDYLSFNPSIDTLVMVYGKDYVGGGGAFVLSARALPFQLPTINDLKNLEKIEQDTKTVYREDDKYKSTNVKADDTKLYFAKYSMRLQYYKFPLLYSGSVLENTMNLLFEDLREKQQRTKMAENLINNRGHMLFGTKDSSNAVIPGNDKPFEPAKINWIYFDSLMNLFAKKNTVIYFYVPPINQSTYSKYKNSLYQKTFNLFIKELSTKYPKLKIFSGNEYLPNNCFGDFIHVNAKGCDSATKQFSDFLHR